MAMAAVLDDLSSLDGPLIAVGDVTARVMLELDMVPDLALIDGQTKRMALNEDETVDTSHFPVRMTASSPAGVLTPNLLEQLERALRGGSVRDDGGRRGGHGAVVPSLACPVGDRHRVGMPGWGLMVQRTTLAMKERCRTILNAFEVK